MTRKPVYENGPQRGSEWPRHGAVSVTIPGSELRIDDLGSADPHHPFWIVLTVMGHVGDAEPEPHPRVAVLHGLVDGTPWTATVQAGLVKRHKGKYEMGWERLISVEIGLLASAGTRLPGWLQHRGYLAQQTLVGDAQPEIRKVMSRVIYAAERALIQLERNRRVVMNIWHGEPQAQVGISQLTIDEQIEAVAVSYNEALREGVRGRRRYVSQATGLSVKTAYRRIQAAREKGLLKERGER